ncbi:hypothetical protein ACEN30_00345 [Marinilactibacillus psychrotolerans]|uniref:hypothetical protein n=1 Tax=Marinilactibacillus psychrotolerans TaxID=191770 RepID=UPI003888A360
MIRSDLKGKRFGRLVALEPLPDRQKGRIVWRCQCDCGNQTDVVRSYLTTGQTKSCGCLKVELEKQNLRDKYDDKRINSIVMPLFKGKEPRVDSNTGYRGVQRYLTRVGRKERYRAYIKVNGQFYKKAGFLSAEDAYYNGRLVLEKTYLPKNSNGEDNI